MSVGNTSVESRSSLHMASMAVGSAATASRASPAEIYTILQLPKNTIQQLMKRVTYAAQQQPFSFAYTLYHIHPLPHAPSTTYTLYQTTTYTLYRMHPQLYHRKRMPRPEDEPPCVRMHRVRESHLASKVIQEKNQWILCRKNFAGFSRHFAENTNCVEQSQHTATTSNSERPESFII